ncbi:MAG: hypothetical protein IKV82_04555 [Akkermansia sp.]|nr:hypothetical protein [Akkermansia sp.]
MSTAYLEEGFYPLSIESDSNVVIEAGPNPVRNMVGTANDNDETEIIRGWLKVNVPSERTCRITALVDDNGSFTINGATTEISPGAHGSRRYTPEVEVTLKPGYYFVECRVEDLPPLNQSYSNVKHYQAFIKWNDDNGSEVTQAVTQLYDISEYAEEVNLMKKADAQRLMACYNVYNYINMPNHSQVWNAIGGTAKDELGPNSYSCAARVSQALCDYGVSLPSEPNLNEGGGFLHYKNANKQVVYVRAISIHNFMTDRLGPPSFTSKAAFDAMLTELTNNGYDLSIDDNKPIIVWSEFVGTGHVGMGYNREGSASQGTFGDAQSIWVLYRPDLAEPSSSSL